MTLRFQPKRQPSCSALWGRSLHGAYWRGTGVGIPNASVSTAEFFGLEPGKTYYVKEVDASGAILEV